MTESALAGWLARIESFSPHEIDLGLDRVGAVYAKLEMPRAPTVLTVGGTNGKGSTVAFLAALLGEAGYTYGAYTSPHLHEYNERVRIGDRLATDEELVAAFERIDAVRGDTPLTYFEFGTLAALLVLAGQKVNVAVLEVGLGGRLDAVNVVDADAALVTNVSLDHCEWLGSTIEAIAFEKAGIFRAGRPAVFAGAVVPASLKDHAEAIGARLVLAGRDYTTERAGDTWRWSDDNVELNELPIPTLGGEFQLQNAAGALALLSAAGLDKALRRKRVVRAIASATLPGRMQRLSRDSEWLFDVAHNPAGSLALANALDAPAGEQVAIVGLLEDKDIDGVIMPLVPHIDRWIAVKPSSERAVPAEELARRIANLSDEPCLVADSAAEAIAAAEHRLPADSRVIVLGSFFTVGPVQRALGLYSPSS